MQYYVTIILHQNGQKKTRGVRSLLCFRSSLISVYCKRREELIELAALFAAKGLPIQEI